METLEHRLKELKVNKRASKALSIAFVEEHSAKKQSVNCPIGLISDAYNTILDNADDPNGFFSRFSTTGLDICSRELQKGNTTIPASPHVFSVFKTACNNLGISLDISIPDVIAVKAGYPTDTYLFSWPDVPLDWLTTLQKKWLSVKLEEGNIGRKVYTGDVYATRKYQNLMKSAESRHVDFTITFNELKEVLEQDTCHFTGNPLISFEHDSSQVRSGELILPDNYRTIDRLDNTKGYVPGNIVACSKVINDLKGEYELEEFEVILNEVKKLKSKYNSRHLATIKKVL